MSDDADKTTGGLKVRVAAASDQSWAMLREHFADITRIAQDGPRNDDHDRDVVLVVFNVVGGDLRIRRAT